MAQHIQFPIREAQAGGRLLFTLALAVVLAACSASPAAPPAISLTAAKQITTDFHAEELAPPRTIEDVTAALDSAQPDPQFVAANRDKADAQPPASASQQELAKFYFARSGAAEVLGRYDQSLADCRRAAELGTASGLPYQDLRVILRTLAYDELQNGNYRDAENTLHQANALQSNKSVYTTKMLEDYYSLIGDYDAAAKARDFVVDAASHPSTTDPPAPWAADDAQTTLLDAQGRYADAELSLRQGIVAIKEAKNPDWFASNDKDLESARNLKLADWYLALADNLGKQGRLVEAEVFARDGLRSYLVARGRNHYETSSAIVVLAGILDDQGRSSDAEVLYRSALAALKNAGVAADSDLVAEARMGLVRALLSQRKWSVASQMVEQIRLDMKNRDIPFERLFGRDLDWPVAIMMGGHASDAVAPLRATFAYREQYFDKTSYDTAEAGGLLAAAVAKSGDTADALSLFAASLPNLIANPSAAPNSGPKRIRLEIIVEAYLDLISSGQSGDADKAFEATQFAAANTVQNALAAAAARTHVTDAALADLVRRDQDAGQQLAALEQRIAALASASDDQRPQQMIDELQQRRNQLIGAIATLDGAIEQQFPDYAKLVRPAPASIASVQNALHVGEALIVVYVGEQHTFVWAIPKTGKPLFHAAAMSRSDVEAAVSELRRSLNPNAATLGDIPAFDVALSNRLYEQLLRPVEAGWKGSSNLLVVRNKALGELPFTVLVTRPFVVSNDKPGQPLFSSYKTVPWLIRDVAITELPSVNSLIALGSSSAGVQQRRPFIGFGDPWFNQQEAAAAQQGEQVPNPSSQLASSGGLAVRGVQIALRKAPATSEMTSADIGVLPRLPETAGEVRAVAEALGADPNSDVFLGAKMNEQTLATMTLDDRRVVMFATHGLVPGDLDGLSEPALALSAPSVSGVPGTGLLTTSKILALKLNADWVVLSACNTAAGEGKGAEAVSGLGLAFFYAGTRALLVTNWPVETNSARALTTGLFKREGGQPRPARAQALRQTELGMIDTGGPIDPKESAVMFSYAHPIFWAPFSLIGDGS